MIDGDVDSAQVVTQRTISDTMEDGSIIKKQVWVSLDTPNQKLTAVEKASEIPASGYDPAYDPEDISSPQPERTKKSQVSIYLKYTSGLMFICS